MSGMKLSRRVEKGLALFLPAMGVYWLFKFVPAMWSVDPVGAAVGVIYFSIGIMYGAIVLWRE